MGKTTWIKPLKYYENRYNQLKKQKHNEIEIANILIKEGNKNA